MSLAEKLHRISKRADLREKFKHYAKSAAKDGDCLLHNKKPTKEGGYAAIGQDTNKEGITLHNFAYFFEAESEVGDRIKEAEAHPTHQVSHLCGKASCLKREHLCFESAKANNSRKGCVGTIVVEIDGKERKFSACKHLPRCKTIARGAEL